MNNLSSLLFHAKTGSLWLLQGLLRGAVISLGMALGGTVLLLFWSAGATSALLEALTEQGPAARVQRSNGSL
jgi:hypothetical protein